MPPTLRYLHTHEPLLLRHVLRSSGAAIVSVSTWGLAAAQLSPDAPVKQLLAAPLPPLIRVQFSVAGKGGTSYVIETVVEQAGWTDTATIRGTLREDGQALHTLTISPEEAIARGVDFPAAAQAPAPPPLARPASPPPPVAAPRSRAPSLPRPSLPRRKPKAAKPRRERGRYKVWFGTNRRPVLQRGRLKGFSGERDTTVHHGWCRVVIPESHKIGSIGSSWWKRLITLTDDRLRVVEVTEAAEESFWSQMAKALREAPIAARDAVVFLHGYNVSFEEAALRSAQLGFDLDIRGVMAFYSWPSKGTLQGYPADEATIEASEGYIADFLTSIAERSGAAKIHIIAHSMGNRGLLRAIDRIAMNAASRTTIPFDQIILAAADVDQDTFRRLSVAYARVARRTTMYVCSKDRAVEASHWLHDFPRAGLVPPVLVVPGVDTISVSNLDLTLLGHGYVAEARELLTDIHTLLRHDAPPEKRFGLRKETGPFGPYWVVGA